MAKVVVKATTPKKGGGWDRIIAQLQEQAGQARLELYTK